MVGKLHAFPYFSGPIAQEWTAALAPASGRWRRRRARAPPNFWARKAVPSPPSARMAPSIKTILLASGAILAASVPAAALWGFTVDDALISARLAHQIAAGRGYRFNPEGPVVDAVTPLGWAPLLSLFAEPGPLAAFAAAKKIGLLAWLAAAGLLGTLCGRLGPLAFVVCALALFSSVPLASWAVSGMETGLVTALATLGLLPWRGASLALGLSAALRPELLPWAVTLAGVRAVQDDDTLSGSPPSLRVGLAVAATLVPFVAVALFRQTVFGQAAPLALLAKPSDLAHGTRYALGALAFSGPVWLLVAGRAYGRSSPRTRATLIGLGIHGVALVAAGGDWMPLYRLLVPVLPSVILAGAELAQLSASRLLVLLRLSAMLGASALVAWKLGPPARDVGAQRAELIAAAGPALWGARCIAALDVGWVGAASPAEIVDLAGVTDPSIARLAGGHTTKRLPEGLLEVRAVDAVVLLAHEPKVGDWPDLAFARGVEARLTTLLSFSEFRPVIQIPLRGTKQSYVIARRRLGSDAAPTEPNP